MRQVTGLVPVLQHANPIVLEDHFVVLGIGDCGILTIHGAHLRITLRGTPVPWDDSTIMKMAVPYEATGRTQQKSRTRQALVDAARRLLADGLTPRVEDAAADAGISRTTAYRYFANQRSLLVAAQPQIQPQTLLGPDAPTDPQARLDAFMTAFTGYNLQWE